MYAIDKDNKLIRLSDGAAILSLPDGDAAYSCYLDWLAAGNTPLPYEPPAADLKAAARAELAASDKEMARIAEDLINVMLTKGVIAESDIPESARDKMDRRAKLRARQA